MQRMGHLHFKYVVHNLVFDASRNLSYTQTAMQYLTE